MQGSFEWHARVLSTSTKKRNFVVGMRQNVLKKIMGPSQKSEEHSFFGGPLSTRKTCRAAVRKQQNVEGVAQGETPPPPQRAARKGDATRKLKTLSRREETMQRPYARNLPPVRNLGSAPPQSRQTQSAGKDVDRLQKIRMAKQAKLRLSLKEEGIKKMSPSRDVPVKKKVQVVQRTTGIKRKPERNVEDGLQQRRHSFARDTCELPASGQRLSQNRQRPGVVVRRRPVPTLPPDLADFIDDGDEDGPDDVDWRTALRKCTKYDPSKFRDNYDLDDRCMESSLRQCWKEERRSQFIGRLEDQREFERERSRRSHRS